MIDVWKTEKVGKFPSKTEENKEKIKKGKTATVTIKIDTAKISDIVLNSRLTIISNDPERPEIIVRIVGEITK